MNHLTPRKAAALLGVSESSVRRLCDRGELQVVKTQGNHRRIPLEAVIAYAEQAGLSITVKSDITTVGGGKLAAADVIASRFYDQLLRRDMGALEMAIEDLHARGWAAARIIDEIMATALRQVGANWAHGEVGVDEEHEMTAICRTLLYFLRARLPAPKRSRPILCCAPEYDPYLLPTTMAAVALIGAGLTAIEIGPNTPAKSLAKAIERYKPRGVAISLTAQLPENLALMFRPVTAIKSNHKNLKIVFGGQSAPSEGLDGVDFIGRNCQELVDYFQRL